MGTPRWKQLLTKAKTVAAEGRAIKAKADAETRELTADERTAYEAKHAEAMRLHDEAKRAHKDADNEAFLAKLAGDPGPTDDPDDYADEPLGGLKMKDKQVLTKDESVATWVKARHGGGEAYDTDGAWNAFAKGIVHGDWQKWTANYASKAMSTSEPGGGYLVPDLLSATVIDRMRAVTPILAAGATTVPMESSTLDIARISGDPTASWHAESAAITPSDATIDRVRFTARTLPVLVKTSRELTEDAPNLGAVVQKAIAGASGVELTRVALRGSGVAPEPRGILNQSGVTLAPVGANGGPLTIDLLIDAVTTMRGFNAEPTGWITSPRTDGGVSKMSKSTQGEYFPLPPPLDKLGRFYSSIVPTNLSKGTGSNLSELYLGAWAELLIGMRVNLRIQPLAERFADTGEVAFLSWFRCDIQLGHGASFLVIPDTTT